MIKAVFLDRDGTINIDRHYVHLREQFQYEPGALEGMKLLNSMGFKLIIVTNQSGIARGYFSEEEYLKFNKWIVEDLRKNNVEILDSYYCPHLPDATIDKYHVDCKCRKPKTGMFWCAQSEHNIDMDNSYAIGDNQRDLSICLETGITGFLITEDAVNNTENGKINTCSSLYDAAMKIKNMEGGGLSDGYNKAEDN